MRSEPSKNQFSRRDFISNFGKSLVSLSIANLGLYAVGSAFKKLDGSLVAGAKTGNWQNTWSAPDSSCGPGSYSPPPTGPCTIGDSWPNTCDGTGPPGLVEGWQCM